MARTTIIKDEAMTDALLDTITHGWGATDPTVDAPEWFINTAQSKLKRNTGTPAAPVYVDELTLESGALIWVL